MQLAPLQKKQRKAERRSSIGKSNIRRLQELELELKDKVEALERKKAEAERLPDALDHRAEGAGDSDRGLIRSAASSRPR